MSEGTFQAPLRRQLPATASVDDLVRRTVDVVAATALLLLLAPVLLLIAVAVRRDSPGPALFLQERVGRGGRTFRCWKFRSMQHEADPALHRDFVTSLLQGTNEAPEEGMYKLNVDPRITRVGHLLRRTSLDELPQLVNVLRGEMSLVGPRPAIAYEVDQYSARHRRRLEVKPGMTGLWQVSGRSEVDMLAALDLDVEYVERRTLSLDLAILLRTVPTVLRRRGAR